MKYQTYTVSSLAQTTVNVAAQMFTLLFWSDIWHLSSLISCIISIITWMEYIYARGHLHWLTSTSNVSVSSVMENSLFHGKNKWCHLYYILMCFVSCWTDAILHRVQFILTCCMVMFKIVAAQSYTAAIAAIMTSKNIWHNFVII